MSDKYTVGQYLVDRLYEIGVNHLFAIPGDYCADWVQTYVQPGPIERIGPTNELNAGYAADGYARIHGVGAVCVTYSVGAFSLLNAITGSYVEKVPVIAINGAPSVAKRIQYEQTGFMWHHFVNGTGTDLNVYEKVTVAADRIDNPDLAPDQIDYLLEQCISQSGPVYLEITEDMYDLPCRKPRGKLRKAARLSDASYLEEAIRTVKGKLEIADNPIIWTGVEIERYGLGEKVEELLKQLDLPFASTLLGKAAISETNPLFIGVFDGQASAPEVQVFFEKSDYVLALGVWLTDINNLGFTPNYDITSFCARDGVKTGGDFLPQVTLEDLVKGLIKAKPSVTTRQMPKLKPYTPPNFKPSDETTYQGFYDFIGQYITPDTIVCGGTGFNDFGSLLLPVDTPGGYIAQAAYTDIGYVSPAGLGAAVATQGTNKRVLVFAGDGGFQMTPQCISTMDRLGLNPIIFVIDNGVYGIEQWLADPSIYDSKEPFYPLSVLHRWEYYKLPAVFGGKGWKVTNYGELEAAVAGALKNTDSPSLIQVVVPSKSIPINAEWKVKEN